MAGMGIRQAGTNDLALLYDFYQRCGKTQENGYFERCLEEQAQGRRVLYLAEAEGALAGLVILNFQPRYSLYRKLEIPEIQDLNVLPALRRQGIGAALINHCESVVRNRGADHIGISVGLTPSYGAAQRLYIRLGYLPDGNGVTYDRETVSFGEVRPINDDLCLMMIKPL